MTTYITDHTRAVLAAGLAWLHDTEQPDTAVIQQHRGVTAATLDRLYQFVPVGHNGGPVIVVTVVCPVYEGGPNNQRLTNGLAGEAEMDAYAAVLAELGYPPVDRWNGAAGTEHGSFRLPGRAHPSLLAAVDRYHAGCPQHHTVFCGWQGLTEAEKKCTWYADGYQHLIKPVWPARPAAATVGESK